METTLSFPGLGIGEFTLNRIAFSLFGKPVYWYGLIILFGIIVAYVHAHLRCKQEGIKADDLMDVGIFTVPIGVIGARLYYVFFDFIKYPDNYNSFRDVIAVWEGGLAIYGGVIFGALTVLVVSRVKKINTLKLMDTIAPGVMIAQAIGRWGNFFNGEAHGGVVSEGSPLYFLRMGLLKGEHMQYVHPTFFYESMWNILGFVLITIFYRKKKFNGQIVLSYLAWYGFGRMFIESLRTDSLYLGPVRVSLLIGALCFTVGVGLLIAGFVATRKGLWEKWLKVTWAMPMATETAGNATGSESDTDAVDSDARNEAELDAESTDGSPHADTPDGDSNDTE